MPRIARKEEQQPTRPRRRGHDGIYGGEDQPVAPILEDGADTAQQAHGRVIQVAEGMTAAEAGRAIKAPPPFYLLLAS